MYILDKNTDYYDYFSHIYGEDKSITFDRRGSAIIKDEMLVDLLDVERRTYRKAEQFIILEVGDKQYLIRMWDFVLREIEFCFVKEFVSCKMEVVHKGEGKNKFGVPISIRGAEIPYTLYWGKNKTVNYASYTVSERRLRIDLPILAGTSLTALIAPEEIWRELSNYISSLKNDKDIVEAPDIEKVVNHGFDKKVSFRGTK